MNAHEKIEISKALAVCAELTGTLLSETAMRVMIEDLADYPFTAVMTALKRCRREINGHLTLAAILARLDDGWPTAEEAFAALAEGWLDERKSVLTTHIALTAGRDAYGLFLSGDKVGARMAFRATYERLVSIARADKQQPVWQVSSGTDKAHLETVTLEGIRTGRLDRQRALAWLPAGEKRLEVETGRVLTEAERLACREQAERLTQLLNTKVMHRHLIPLI